MSGWKPSRGNFYSWTFLLYYFAATNRMSTTENRTHPGGGENCFVYKKLVDKLVFDTKCTYLRLNLEYVENVKSNLHWGSTTAWQGLEEDCFPSNSPTQVFLWLLITSLEWDSSYDTNSDQYLWRHFFSSFHPVISGVKMYFMERTWQKILYLNTLL